MSEITYDDKVDLNVESTIANINKVTASDMNQIKSVVNANAETLDEINVPSNWVKVGDTIPTDGRKVLFKGSKNLLDMSQVQIGKAWNGDTNSARAVVYMKCYPNIDYTISFNSISNFDGMYWVEKANASDTSTTYGPSQVTGTRTITTKATSHYIVIQFAKTNISINDFNGVNIQIEQGSSATTYEPYIEQDLIVNGGKFIADQLVSVGATNPNDGRRVWFSKSKNLMNFNLITTRTSYGVTFTKNSDGTITLNNTATGTGWVDLSNINYGSTAFNLGALSSTLTSVTNGDYTMSGKISNSAVNISYNASNGITACYVTQGNNYNNAILQVQFEKNKTATSYEPYIQQGIYVDEELWYQKSGFVDISDTQPTNGANLWVQPTTGNLLNYRDFQTKTTNGIDIVNNHDGTFTIKGTATADVSVPINDVFIPMSGTWRMLGCPSGGSSTTYMLSAYVGYWGSGSPNIDTGSGTNITYTGNVKIRFYIKSGTTCNNLIFKPMLTTNTSTTINGFAPKGPNIYALINGQYKVV